MGQVIKFARLDYLINNDNQILIDFAFILGGGIRRLCTAVPLHRIPIFPSIIQESGPINAPDLF